MVTQQYGVLATGFNKKTFAVIQTNLQENAKRMFGSDVDLTPGSPIKLYIDLFSAELVALWNELENCYKAQFIDTASNASLDSLGKLVGAVRGRGLYATGTITFFRNTPLPSGAPRIIPTGTKVSTSTIRPISFVTTETVYFQPLITAEEHMITDTEKYDIDLTNMIYEITTITGSDGVDYLHPINPNTPKPTYVGRTVSFNEPIEPGVTLSFTYQPLSVTAKIIAVLNGSDSNVSTNLITIMNTVIDFVHHIGNEDPINTGADVESDSHFRQQIIGATQSIGKATKGALEYYLGQLNGVKTAMVEDPLRVDYVDTVTGDGTYVVTCSKTPLAEIITVIGTVSGQFVVTSMDFSSGELILDKVSAVGESIVITYQYAVPGKIKIYIQGGTCGG